MVVSVRFSSSQLELMGDTPNLFAAQAVEEYLADQAAA